MRTQQARYSELEHRLTLALEASVVLDREQSFEELGIARQL
jgi:hypothetical protein